MSPVTFKVPPTVALLVTSKLSTSVAPAVKPLRVVCPSTFKVPPTVALLVTSKLSTVVAPAVKPARVVSPTTSKPAAPTLAWLALNLPSTEAPCLNTASPSVTVNLSSVVVPALKSCSAVSPISTVKPPSSTLIPLLVTVKPSEAVNMP